MRAFIAVPASDEVRSRAEELLAQLRAADAARTVRWVATEQLHLTLRFLGEVPEQLVGPIEQAMRAAAGCRKPFTLRLARLGAFPHWEAPRVLWAGVVEGEEELASLARALEPELSRLGFPPDQRPFRAHLTLGRCKGGRLAPQLEAACRATAADLGAMRVESVHLYESRLTPVGPVYRVRRTVPLGSGP